jgi:two-component system, NtrC family, sensor kinase
MGQSRSEEGLPVDRDSAAGLAVVERRAVHVHDALSPEGGAFPETQGRARRFGHRTVLCIPLLREGESIGVIVLRRMEVNPFGDRQIALLQTFADQAVIALGNVRLFDEVQARTRELAETLEYQTATSEVLNVISRSPNNLRPVMDTIVQTAQRLCASEYALILHRDDGGSFRIIGHANASREFLDWLENNPVTAGDGTAVGLAAVEKKTIHLPDALADPRFTDFGRQQRSRARTMLAVPLMQEADVIGVVFLARTEVKPFTARQVDLVTTFADQAVIAIQNVKLFEVVQAKTRDLEESLQQQTAIGDVLKTISRSTFDLRPVLDTLVETAARLCNTDRAIIMRREGDVYLPGAAVGYSDPFFEFLKSHPLAVDRGTITGRAALERRAVQILDMATDPEYALPQTIALSGQHSAVAVPLLRENEPIGVLVLGRQRVEAFTPKQIDLLTTFADQAVIAIENVRLFDELRQRTDDLAASLNELRTAQDRLIQTEKLASLGQLTAGIAHEIKNPLNFVNNFSALSVELTDELNDVLKQASLAEKIRAEIDELTGLLKDNLRKVVQHGKRADSIVKNMLLHSREGSGEHRPADVNALVDESLNLAYHGARAEKPQFNVTLMRNFDPDAGQIEVFPQEITRVLLNLISNGFYAVAKRKADNGGANFEPLVIATTKGGADRVEIRIRDNGTGILPHVKEKMFNPFFTTKPAGDGTGLGLSMSHDIIVKQHGGTIEVESEPGEFTEFTIVLPRTKSHLNKTRG